MNQKLNYVQCCKKCIDVQGSGLKRTVMVGKGIRLRIHNNVVNPRHIANPQHIDGRGLLNSINFAKKSKHISLVY